MSQIETLGILDEIETLVSDKLQVVSFKWLSRNYLVSSNTAKKLLQEFIEKHETGLEVVYTLAGWLKKDPSSYHIRLVSGPKLAEAKQDYEGNCSVQVYSVQACIPKDPAALWNAEFVQAEELFKQPSNIDNCLRDNRFCGISNSLVKRNFEGSPVSSEIPISKSSGPTGVSKSSCVPPKTAAPIPQQTKVQQSSPQVNLQPPSVPKDVKSESNGTENFQAAKLPADKEKAILPGAGKKRGQSDRSSSETGSSLANLWGRASTKSKASCAPKDTRDNTTSNPTVVSADAQISANEEVGEESSDDERGMNFRRASNGERGRKRRVVLDFSDEDECEDAVNLVSPDDAKEKSFSESKKCAPSMDKQKQDKPREDKATEVIDNQSVGLASAVIGATVDAKKPSSKDMESHSIETDVNKRDKATDDVQCSPKRRKVLKMRIDERGREVTEVVWEGEETEMKKVESSEKRESGTVKKANNSTVASTVNRPPANKKSPAVGITAPSNAIAAKAGNKKAGNPKDPKQGNILSFFKRV